MIRKYNDYDDRNAYYNLIRSFRFAVRGIGYALKHERNLRIHFSVTAFVLYFTIRYYNLSETQYAVLFLAIGLVIVCEMLNTALEKTVDLANPDYNRLAKISKDVAAGAVLTATATAAVIGGLLLWKPDSLLRIGGDILDNILIWLLVLIIEILWVVWPQRNAIIRRGKKQKVKK